jgi:hypothetical protein
MKSLIKLSHLLLIVACASPLLANASSVNMGRPNDYSYKKNSIVRSGPDFRKNNTSSTPCCNTNHSNSELRLLSPIANSNNNLAQGTYQFGQFESSFNRTFADRWTFTLEKNGGVSLSVFNQDPGGLYSGLVNATNLQLQLFDGSNKFLGSIDSNHALSLSLLANTQYSFVVSGAARGLLGGFYLGKLDIGAPVAAVPIGDALPMFTAALLLLGWQFRVRSVRSTMTTIAS